MHWILNILWTGKNEYKGILYYVCGEILEQEKLLQMEYWALLNYYLFLRIYYHANNDVNNNMYIEII